MRILFVSHWHFLGRDVQNLLMGLNSITHVVQEIAIISVMASIIKVTIAASMWPAASWFSAVSHQIRGKVSTFGVPGHRALVSWSCWLSQSITEISRIRLALFDRNNRIFGPYLAGIHSILISVTNLMSHAERYSD
jgi:hypothetical protein